MENLTIRVDGKEYKVRVEETADGKILVHCGKDVYEVETYEDVEKSVGKEWDDIENKENVIKAPLPGTIVEVKVKKGDKVKANDPLIKLISMKMENEIRAPKTGKIKEVWAKKKDNVNRGDPLIEME